MSEAPAPSHSLKARLVPSGLPQRVHFLGLGGAGVSGAARVLAARGHLISGHDRAPGSLLEGLAQLGMQVRVGPSRSEDLPLDAQLVVRSAAVPLEDPQLVRARQRGLPVLKYAELLPLLAPPRHTLAVAGTHGKTTSAWMLLHALRGLAQAAMRPEPGALIGGTCRTLRTNALAGAVGGAFVFEACEYDRSFLQLAPQGALITNVEADHLDYYGSLAAIEEAFARFADRVHEDGLLVVGSDVPESIENTCRARVWRLGRELHIDALGQHQGNQRMRLRGPGWATPPLQLGVPGAFNAQNAALALGLAIGLCAGTLESSAAAAAAAAGIEDFVGAGRRFEPWGEAGGISVIHDYAHHPTELEATLSAARARFPGRALHLLFQPHQFSRTARFLPEFAAALARYDRVVVSDVYGARNHIDGGNLAGAPELVEKIRALGGEARHGGALREALPLFIEELATDAVALVVGAGDIEDVKHELLRELAVCRAAGR